MSWAAATTYVVGIVEHPKEDLGYCRLCGASWGAEPFSPKRQHQDWNQRPAVAGFFERSSMPPSADPRYHFRLLHGSGALTAANVNGSPAECPLTWAPGHWLTVASGGVREAPWRHLEAAVYAG